MTNTEIGLALVGTLFAVIATGYAVVWHFGERPKLRYQKYLSGLTKHGSYSSGSAPD
jgi:hypothetical protein